MKSLAYFFFFGYNKCMEKLIVTQKYDNKKLSKIVLDEKKEIHYPLFCKLLRKKDIKVNGKRVNKDIIVHEKDEITLYLPEEKKENKIIQIIYEDNNILVVNKEAGMEVTGQNSLTEKLPNILQVFLLYLNRNIQIFSSLGYLGWGCFSCVFRILLF